MIHRVPYTDPVVVLQAVFLLLSNFTLSSIILWLYCSRSSL